jgi:hypothetical protein
MRSALGRERWLAREATAMAPFGAIAARFCGEDPCLRKAKSFAMFLSGLAGVMAFNVIIGVFGLIPAEIGLLAFIVTAVFVIARSSRRDEGTHV